MIYTKDRKKRVFQFYVNSVLLPVDYTFLIEYDKKVSSIPCKLSLINKWTMDGINKKRSNKPLCFVNAIFGVAK